MVGYEELRSWSEQTIVLTSQNWFASTMLVVDTDLKQMKVSVLQLKHCLDVYLVSMAIRVLISQAESVSRIQCFIPIVLSSFVLPMSMQ